MNYRNPTFLQIGQVGDYGGRTWRLVGRVVLGVVEDGEIYFWNEFNLETTGGETATLVYEKTDRGAQWRWFTQFEPEYPMTATDAATKEVGDPLNLDGTDVRVTLLESSRIYFAEGKPPEGEVVGSEASYFNAENGDEMLVVSWTGEIVECYRGRTITDREVRQAFKPSYSAGYTRVPAGGLSRYDRQETSRSSAWNLLPKVFIGLLVCILVVLIIITLFPSVMRSGRYAKITRINAPPAFLKVGAAGKLAGMDYRITGHVLVAVAEVNSKIERHEYFLCNKLGGKALLVSSLTSKDNEWELFTPLHPLQALTPLQAGAVQLGQIVRVGGEVAPVDTLFSSTIESAEFDGPPEVSPGATLYGFMGHHDSQNLLVRWDARTITFMQGQRLSSRSVRSGFGLASGW